MAGEQPKPPVRVQVVNIDVPFFQLMWLIVKFVLAAIPAMIVAIVIVVFLLALLRGFGMGLI